MSVLTESGSEPARVAAARGRWVVGAGAVTAVVGGGVAAASPVIVVVAAAGLAAVTAVWMLPLASVAIAVLADGVVFPLLIAGGATSVLSLGVLGSVSLAVAAVLWRRQAYGPVVFWVTAIAALAVPSSLLALMSLPLAQTLSGVRYLAVPLLVGVLATTLTDRSFRILFRGVTVLMVVSFVATIIETALGSDRLLALTNLDYGVSIRNIGDALRAPGTFATNYHLGAFSSVVAVAALLWWGTLEGSRRDLVWRVVATVASLGCLALSTYRTGVVILVISVLAAIFLSGNAIPGRVKALIVLLGAGVAIGFFAIGLGDSKSLFQRFEVWAQLLAEGSSPFGGGVGSAGAASGAAGSTKQVFTDNYYLSLWLQFGLAGLAMTLILLAVAVWLIQAGRAGNKSAGLAAPLWIGVLVGLAVVELWEYTSTMALVIAITCKALSGSSRSQTRLAPAYRTNRG